VHPAGVFRSKVRRVSRRQSEWLQLIFQSTADDMERLQSDVSDIKRMVSHPASSARQAAPH
jgi:hypothetical protein